MAEQAKALLVDDRRDNLLALEAILQGLPVQAVAVESGEAALKQLLTDDFAVILLDAQMPNMDGFETAGHIKRRERTRHVPILFLTAADRDAQLALRGYAVGAVDYLTKPFDPWVLRAKVSIFVELWTKTQQLKAQAEATREREAQWERLTELVDEAARALRAGGRLLGIHSAGSDPGMEIVQRVWPGEDPFVTSRHELVEATRSELGDAAEDFTFDPLPAARALFRYEMHTLPDEIDREAATIGTSTLLAAWNAAVYVAQIDDERVTSAMSGPQYLEATRAVLKKYGELWFNDESYIIARKP